MAFSKPVEADASRISFGTEPGIFMDGSLMVRSLLLQVIARTLLEDVSFVSTTLVSLDINSDDLSPDTLIRFPSFSHDRTKARLHVMSVIIFVFIFCVFLPGGLVICI